MASHGPSSNSAAAPEDLSSGSGWFPSSAAQVEQAGPGVPHSHHPDWCLTGPGDLIPLTSPPGPLYHFPTQQQGSW